MLTAHREDIQAPTDGVFHTLPVAEVLARFGTSIRGLSPTDVVERAARYGPNTLPRPRRRSPVLQFARQFTDLFAVVLEVASVLTFTAYLLQVPREIGTLQLSVAILGVVVLNAAIGFVQEYSAERTVEALQAMVAQEARVLREGERVAIPAEQVVPGDVVVLEAGDAVPADCRLIEAYSMSVNNAALTGESAAVRRTAEPVGPSVPAAQAANCVFMGTTVTSGVGKAVVYATGTSTEFGRIYRLTADAPRQQTPLQRQVVLMARRVSGIALSIGTLMMLTHWGTGHPLVASFVFALGVMVACVPEGLPATQSVSLAVGVRRMARRNALVKRLLAVEALGSTTVICTDKTGTLTQAEMTVQRCWVDGAFHGVTGVGYAPEGEVEDPAQVRDLLRLAGLCGNAKLLPPDANRPWRVLGDPTEAALLVAARKAGLDLAAEEASTPRLLEFPFDPVRKLMTTVHRTGRDSWQAYVKGAADELLARSTAIRWNGELRPLDDRLREEVERAADAMARDSLRVLGVACRSLDRERPDQATAESDLVFLGLVGMLDPPRAEVTEAVAATRRAGIRIIMVTGDYALTAEAIARRVGIVRGTEPVILTGVDLARMDEAELQHVLRGSSELLFCRVSPEDKMRIVAALQALGEVVAVTGDGANDAPALKRADIGVAMGVGGTDVAREAAEMVLLDDSFASIVAAIELGRSVYRNIQKFLVYVFTSNVGELVPIVVAVFAGYPVVPLTALQILTIDLGSDVLPALALGTEPPEPDTMKRTPRSRRERLFSGAVIRRLLFLGALEAAGSVFAFFWTVASAGLAFSAIHQFTVDDSVYRKAITMVQAAIVVGQVFAGFAVRADRESIFRLGLLSNPRYVVAQCIGIAIISAISYLPPLQALFHTAPLGLVDWAVLIAFGLVLLLADESRKLYLRVKERRGS